MIQFYDHQIQKLAKPHQYKVKRIIELDRIKKEGDLWVCLPIEGYNTRTYTIKKDSGEFRCNCQGFTKRGECSHRLALFVVLRTQGQETSGYLF